VATSLHRDLSNELLNLTASLGWPSTSCATVPDPFNNSLTSCQLYHAICAVSLLSLALKGQQQLLTEAFQHYHQAISSSLSSPSDLHSDRLLYLHFLLLIYDISYATQAPSNTQEASNMNMWEHHIQHLVRIAQHRKGQSNGILQAYLLWYVLYLDNQACLSGNGSGHFARAFLTNDLTMPDWTRIISGLDILRPTVGWQGEDVSSHPDVFTFAQEMFRQGANLCQLQLKLRAEATAQTLHSPAGSSVLAACTQMVDQFQGELYASWHRYCPSYLFQPNSEYATGQLPAIARIFLDFVSPFYLPRASKVVHQTDSKLFFFLCRLNYNSASG
jgi:hypothetical protein